MRLGRRRKGAEQHEETWQPGLYTKLLVLALAVAYLIAFAIENRGQRPAHFVFYTTNVSLIWLILLSLAIGILGGVLISQLYRRRRRQERGEATDPVPDLVDGDEAVSEPGGAEPPA